MIYTVTFNPSIDYILRTPPLQEGEVNRAVGEEMRLGGKGINVSVILSRLGVETVALGFSAGFIGDALIEMVRQEGVDSDFIPLQEGNTRINVKLWGDGGKVTEINAGGPVIDDRAMESFYRKISRLTGEDTLVLAGSVPASLPVDIYRQILERISDHGVRTVVDATGDLLLGVLAYRPFLIKPNRSELAEVVGRALPDDRAIEEAARELQNKGARNVLVSLGGDGALLLDEDGQVHRVQSACRQVRYTVGAGDSMVAGFLAGVDRGYEYALRLGSAAGGATAGSEGLATRAEIEALMAEFDPMNV
ncbi:MAG: 1-phosphofructokinase [Clostridia bacterium]|nr:1-phosphofructokinase [Clostridia bacterium]